MSQVDKIKMSQNNKNSQTSIIQPQSVPLSHLNDETVKPSNKVDMRNIVVAAVVAVVVIGAGAVLFIGSEDTQQTQTQAQSAAGIDPNPIAPNQDANSPPATTPTGLAPFAASQQQRAREKAQAALAKFVEEQIRLEDTMQVQTWAQTEMDAAMALAQEGDNLFLEEQFDESLEAYNQAANAISAILTKGDKLHQQHLSTATQAFADLEPELGKLAIADALVLKPDDPTTQQWAKRIDALPDLIKLRRDARNHELAGRWPAAVQVYRQIQSAEPQFPDLTNLLNEAQREIGNAEVAQHITEGFAALNTGKYDAARRSFNAALKQDPNNDIAKGGLAQVAKDHDLAIIDQQKQLALGALEREDWSAAQAAYDSVLALDPNVQFARSGKRIALAHAKAWNLLQKISASPERLSNEKLYLEAQTIVDQAAQLTYPGTKLKAKLNEVSDLLTLYRDPVDVVLLSDNATDILVSNVGRLGNFEKKTLKLRPGEYTIRGSQNGCRDIYLTIQVLPGIEPLDLSCPERL